VWKGEQGISRQRRSALPGGLAPVLQNVSHALRYLHPRSTTLKE
jgi:hypothetical protein